MKYMRILSEKFQLLVVKFSVYLNGRVFVVIAHVSFHIFISPFLSFSYLMVLQYA